VKTRELLERSFYRLDVDDPTESKHERLDQQSKLIVCNCSLNNLKLAAANV